MSLKDYDEIVDISFDNKEPHLAICSKHQNYSANGWHTSILTKADDVDLTEDIVKSLQQVTVKLSFEEFLRKFFNLYSSDAELLTKILGMTTEYEEYSGNSEGPTTHEDYLQETVSKFEIMKGSSGIEDIPLGDVVDILKLQQTFEKGLHDLDIAFEEDITSPESEGAQDTATVSPQEQGKTPLSKAEVTPSDVTKNHGEFMDKKDLLKSAEVQDFLKAQLEELQKANDAKVEALKTELQKANDENAVYREEKQARRKEGFTNLVKSLDYVSEEDSEGLVTQLLKMNETDADCLSVVVKQLEKAQEELVRVKEEFTDGSDTGVDVPADSVEINKSAAVADLIEAKYATK